MILARSRNFVADSFNFIVQFPVPVFYFIRSQRATWNLSATAVPSDGLVHINPKAVIGQVVDFVTSHCVPTSCIASFVNPQCEISTKIQVSF